MAESDSAEPTRRDSLRVTLIFRPTEKEPLGRDRDAATAFWRYVAEHVRNAGQEIDTEAIGRLEQSVVQVFGVRLRDTLLRDFGGLGDRHHEFIAVRGDRRQPVFAFRTVGFRYGSLSLDLDVAGVKSLVEFFDGNLEVFQVALGQYAPTALGGSVTSYDRNEIRGMECSAVPSAELVSAFRTLADVTPTPSSRGGGDGLGSKLQAVNWAWILANTSLVVPVLLCIFVWYVTTQGIDKDREQLRQMISSLADKQNEVIKLLVTEHQASLNKPEKTQTPQSAVSSAQPPKAH